MLEKYEPNKARNLLTIILHIIYSDSKVTREDLAELCEISIPSLDRCLSDLRAMNFDIHSFANEGVVILNEIEENIFKTIANEYLISRFSLPIINSSFNFDDLPIILGNKLIMKFLHAYANKFLINLTIQNGMNEMRFISNDPLDIFKNNYSIYFMYGRDSHVYICSFENLIRIQLTNDTSKNTYGDKIKIEKEEFIQREIKKMDYEKKEIERDHPIMKRVDFIQKYNVEFTDAQEKIRQEEEERERREEEMRLKEEEKRIRKIIEEREINRLVIDNVFKQFLDKK